MNFKIIISSFIVIAITVSFVFFRNSTTSKYTKNTLIVGTVADYAPFVSVNAQGELEGFDIDVAKKLAQKMNRELILKDLGSMTPLFISLEQESIDAIIWAISITQERLKRVNFVRYQGENTTAYSLLFWEKIPTDITSIDDMKNMIICVEPTSAQDVVLNKYPFIIKKFSEKVDDALLNIQYGKADAAFVEPAIARKFKARYPTIQILDVPLDEENQVHGMGIAIKQNNTTLTEEIQKNITELQQEGIIKELEKKWNLS